MTHGKFTDADRQRLSAEPAWAPWHGGRERPVGLDEIAALLHVKRGTVDQWRTRDVLPAPVWTVGNRPAWPQGLIEDWARETGRLPVVPRTEPRLDCPEGANERTRMMFSLADRAGEVLAAADGWVSLDSLLPLAPEGRRIVLTEVDDKPFGYDNAAGPAYDAGPSGRPDAAMMEDAVSIVRRRAASAGAVLAEGYPPGLGRAFRIISAAGPGGPA